MKHTQRVRPNVAFGATTLAFGVLAKKTASASDTTRALSRGIHFFEARSPGTPTSTPDVSASHATLTQRVAAS